MEIMELLISKGINVESQSDAGTPLIWAAGHGQPESVKLLLKHNADVSLPYPVLTLLQETPKISQLSFFSHVQKAFSC
jgi:ankyrin repeat protein